MTTISPVAADNPPPPPPPRPPVTPPKPAPASPRPPSGPTRHNRAELTVHRGEHRLTLLAGDRTVATAIRTTWGWHIPRQRNDRGERTWISVDTIRDALVRLYAIAHDRAV